MGRGGELRFRVWEKMPKGRGEDYKTVCDYFKFLPLRACCRRQRNKGVGTWDNLDEIRIWLIELTAQESSLCLINLSPSHLGSLLFVTHKHDEKHRCPGSVVNCLPAPCTPRNLFLHIFTGKPRKRWSLRSCSALKAMIIFRSCENCIALSK